MPQLEIIPWFLMSAALAFIVILPLLSDGPPQWPPTNSRRDR